MSSGLPRREERPPRRRRAGEIVETSALASCQTRGSDRSACSPDPIVRRPQVDLGEKREPRGRCTGSRGAERSIDPRAPNREEKMFPRAASVRICLSSVRSETARRSRSFSFSSAAEAAKLVAAHPAILLAPAVVSDLADPQLPDRVRHRHALAVQDLRLPQHADDLLRLVTLPCHLWSSSFPNLRMDQSDGGGSSSFVPARP